MKKLVVWAFLLGVAAYGGAKLYLHNEVSDAMDMMVMMVSPYASVQYDGVASTMLGELTVEGVTVRVKGFRDELYIDRIGINTPNFFSLLELSDLMTLQAPGYCALSGFAVMVHSNYDFSLGEAFSKKLA